MGIPENWDLSREIKLELSKRKFLSKLWLTKEIVNIYLFIESRQVTM